MKKKLSKETKQSIILSIIELAVEFISVPFCIALIIFALGNGITDKTDMVEMPDFKAMGTAEIKTETTEKGETAPDNPDNPDNENPPGEDIPPEKKPSPKGSFENPYNAKKTIHISYEDYKYFPAADKYAKGDFRVTLKGVLKGKKAYKFLKALDKGNAKPKEGCQWLVLKYEIKYKKGNIKKDFDASYLINPYNNFFSADKEKITSFSEYKPLFGSKEYTHNITRTEISRKETKTLWTAIMVKNDQLPVYYRISTGYTEKEGDKVPEYKWFKIP